MKEVIEFLRKASISYYMVMIALALFVINCFLMVVYPMFWYNILS